MRAADLVQVPSWGAWALRKAEWGTPASTAPLYPDKGLVLLHQHDVTIHRPGRVLAALTAMLALVAVMLPIAPAAAHDHADTTGTYTVTVSHDISGERIQGADVHIESTVDGQPYDEGTVTTDGDGRAEFDGISLDGSLDITVTHDGFLDRNVEIPAAAVVDGGGYSATITPEGHHLHGGVYDADTSDTIAGATVSIDDQGESVTSDAAGDYHLAYLDSGTYTVTADADGYDPYSAEVDIANATLYPINLEPTDDEPAVGTFVVLDAATDDPIEGATVEIDGQSHTTDADGEAVITIDSTVDDHYLNVYADGYAPDETPSLGSVLPGAEFTMTTELTPSVEMSGIEAVAGDGEVHLSWDEVDHPDMMGYRVGWDPPAENSSVSALLDDETTEFTVDNLVNGDTYEFQLRVRMPLGSDVETPETIVTATPQADDDLGTIEGGVFEAATDDPIEGAEVTVANPTGGDTTTTSAADGTYKVDGLETATTYEVTVHADGYYSASQNVPVEDTNTVTADFELDAEEPATGALWVYVYGDMALPLPGVDVELVDEDDTVVGTYATDGTGAVNIDDLAVGEYTVNIDHDGYAPYTTTRTVTSGGTATVTAFLEQEPGDISGQLVDLADGSLVENNANIDLIDSVAIEVDSVFTDDGEFVFDDVAPGTYTLEVSAFGYEDASLTTVQVTSGETTDVTVELDGIPAMLTVNVNDDATGDRLPSATATLNGDDLTATDDGEFFVDDLEPGAYTLVVDADGYTAEQRDFDLDWGAVRLEGFALEVEDDPVDGEIDGLVIDADGTPVAGAEVTIDGRTTTTGDDGTFELDGVDVGTHEVVVTVDGYTHGHAHVDVTAGDSTTMDDVVLTAVDIALACNVHDEGAAPGDHLECAIAALPAGQDVSVAVTLNPTLLDGEFVADEDGNVEFTFDVPDDATGDDEIVIAVEVADAEADATFTLDIVEPDVTTVDPSAEEAGGDQQLPRTGLDLLVLVLMAAAMLTAGGTALRVTSRT